MNPVIDHSVQRVVAEQSFWRRYKGSILIMVTGVVSIISQLAASPELQDTVIATVLTVVATVATALVNRFTRDGVTPSTADQLNAVAPAPATTAPAHLAVEGPMYDQGSTVPEGQS